MFAIGPVMYPDRIQKISAAVKPAITAMPALANTVLL
jgi:hypothetical protein